MDMVGIGVGIDIRGGDWVPITNVDISVGSGEGLNGVVLGFTRVVSAVASHENELVTWAGDVDDSLQSTEIKGVVISN